MPGELGGTPTSILPSTSGLQYPDGVFLHNVDKPFEIHRVHVSVTGFNITDAVFRMFDPQPQSLGRRVRLRIADLSKNEALTKNAVLVDQMVWDNTKTWEWEEPYTIVRSEGFQVQVDTQSYDFINPVTAQVAPVISTLRVEVSFQGFLIVVAPPSETR